MPSPNEHISMALFCDFENVALGVRDANDEKFDIKRVLERLLLKGSIVVKKAYCDWERYKGFKAAMHEANFELIEIPHVRQSGKNSADIRLVVDALDLCYTKSHVNTFVIISGDSDFSPLVSKLRENAKHVIGVGVKQSTSDLLIANCDEFIYYDDLVRNGPRRAGQNTQGGRDGGGNTRRSPEEDKRRREEMDTRRVKAVEMAAETYEALVTDRDDGGRIWASVLKEAIKRRNPGFNENYYGFRTFGNLLEEAQARGLLDFGRDEKSGTWVARGTGVPTAPAPTSAASARAESLSATVPSQDLTEDEGTADLLPQADAEADTADAPQGTPVAAREHGREPGRESGREGGREGGRDSGRESNRDGDRRRNRRGRGGSKAQAEGGVRQGAAGHAAQEAQAQAPAAPAPAPVVTAPAPAPAQASAPAPAPAAAKRPARKTTGGTRAPARKAAAKATDASAAPASDQPASKTATKPARKAAAKKAKPAATGEA